MNNWKRKYYVIVYHPEEIEVEEHLAWGRAMESFNFHQLVKGVTKVLVIEGTEIERAENDGNL